MKCYRMPRWRDMSRSYELIAIIVLSDDGVKSNTIFSSSVRAQRSRFTQLQRRYAKAPRTANQRWQTAPPPAAPTTKAKIAAPQIALSLLRISSTDRQSAGWRPVPHEVVAAPHLISADTMKHKTSQRRSKVFTSARWIPACQTCHAFFYIQMNSNNSSPALAT